MQAEPSNSSTIRALLADAERSLAAGPHSERAQRDVQALLLHALRELAPATNLAWLIAHRDETLHPGAIESFHALIDRRFAGEPIQYITGVAEFYGLTFHVDRNVLIPRPETEHLVEKALAMAAIIPQPRIVDVGTGSGAISVALAHKVPGAKIVATEISAPALSIAQLNAANNNVAHRVSFIQGDLLVPVASEQFDIVVSNPPYVPLADRDSLSVEVRCYEPSQALFAGDDGLAIFRRLIPAAFAVLASGGFVVLEIGYGQSNAINALLQASGFQDVGFTADLQGIPRVASARRP
ncbi:MAG: peptide chain release factor N(5)-glutamine methyltransferase [Terracidiphilus sp.]